MGWVYRKSINFGPIRMNLSRRGVGYSVGVPGFRTGIRATGRPYTRVTMPGTGMSYQTSGSQAGCAIVLVAGLASAAVLTSLLT